MQTVIGPSIWRHATNRADEGWLARTAPYTRTSRRAMGSLSCGEQSCAAAAENDFAADAGRIRLHCDNSATD